MKLAELWITDLIASGAARLQGFGMMTSAVKSSFSVEVDEVDEELFADAAPKARWMPAHVRTESRPEHSDVACHHHFAALEEEQNSR